MVVRSQEPVCNVAEPETGKAAPSSSRDRQPADLLANATCQRIALADIRGAHALLTQTLEKTHPRPIDDVLTLTPSAVQLLCAQHPLIVRTAGRGTNKGFELRIPGGSATFLRSPRHPFRARPAKPCAARNPAWRAPRGARTQGCGAARANARSRAPPRTRRCVPAAG